MKHNVLRTLTATLVLGLSVGASAQTAPTIDIEMTEQVAGNTVYWAPSIYITPQDKNTVIQDVIVNRGSCPVVIAKLSDFAWSQMHEEGVLTKSGKRVKIEEYEILNTKEGNALLDSLDEKEKAELFQIFIPKKRLEYAAEPLEINCNLDTVTEIQIVTNGGTFNFDMREKVAKVVGDRENSFQVAEAFAKMALIDGNVAGAFEKYGSSRLRDRSDSVSQAELHAQLGLPFGCVLKEISLRGSNVTDEDYAYVGLDGTCKNGDSVNGRYTTLNLVKEGNEWKIDMSPK